MISDFFKKNAFAFLRGKKISLPAYMCDPKSNLEQITDFFCNLDYLHKMSKT